MPNFKLEHLKPDFKLSQLKSPTLRTIWTVLLTFYLISWV